MIDSLFILSGLGEVIIEKHYRQGTPRSAIADLFWERATLKRNRDEAEEELDLEEEILPIVSLGSGTLSDKFAVHIKRGDLTFVAGVSRETPPLLVIEFLHRLCDVLTEYLGNPDEVKIKDAFSTVYQILDEMLDGGYPLMTEPNALKGLVLPPTMINKVKAVMMGNTQSNVNPILPIGAISSSPWRDKSLSYLQNEIFVDLEEQLDCVFDSELDEPVSFDVHGSLKVTSRLSGMPEIIIRFEESSLLGDVAFHPCVRIDRWERDRVVCFIPPDGAFELMNYRIASGVVSTKSIIDSLPMYCKPILSLGSIVSSDNLLQGKIEILLGPKKKSVSDLYSPLVVEDVCVRFPLPVQSKYLQAKPSEGKVSFVDRVCIWNVGKIESNKPACRLTGSFSLPASHSANCGSFHTVSSTITLDFKIQTKLISGLKIASLDLVNQNYKYFKGVKSVLKSGEFIIRS